ncbi:hypothetical protein MCBMB27_02611 [Methylobacterium phyllosphaerae]|uniref:Uncharacterized conserved protein YfdQ, DUF2303 family n=1 Tax=Methylobacterium phyllosphaerae TaxID=418223 RepID=A0AAE8HSJ5_9HYPH|nr:DUF2303 family protein [Methylobacterium phyllosphaerae]APT31902.1 hypothetical protein MCBMB27_02611 [Methylobacterium phyllosphaerae]SFH01843.1 Uncharacterized conserved protein YfdQ, DUF2303 family [Methylobacterium phyllosphaerae]
MGASTSTSREGAPHGVAGEAAAITAIAELTKAGQKAEIVLIDTSGLGHGLPEKVPVLMKPGTYESATGIKPLLEQYRTGPERRKGVATVTTLAAFIDLVNRHKDAGSVIFAKTDWPKPALTAVIDYHDDKNAPRHGEHRVHYAFPVTVEFQAWIDGNGQKMEQAVFAQFLEDHAAELSSPFDAEVVEFERLFKATFAAPNELIDLSRSLEIHVGQSVKNSVRLSSGEGEITFAEEHTNRSGEKIAVPGIFMVQLRAFRDGGPVRIPVRLRYRVQGGAIVWSYQLYRWEDELQNRVSQDLAQAGEATELPTFEGQPERT